MMQIAGRLWKRLPPGVRRLLSRLTHQTFTVSVAGVIVASDERVLLLNHVIRPRDGWGLPGGFVDRGEQPIEALRREAAEETGIDISNPRLIGISTINKHIEVLFAARTNDNARVNSPEITELGWFSENELPDVLSSGLKIIIRKVLRQEV